MKRHATAHWQGTGKEGTGSLDTQSSVLKNSPYNFNSRFEDGKHSNPEELIAAAHAGCFSMKLAFVLNEAGFTADNIETKCEISLENGAINSSTLTVSAKVPGIGKEAFEEAVTNAKENCPVSKLLNTQISAAATLL